MSNQAENTTETGGQVHPMVMPCPFCGGVAILKPSKIQIPGIHFAIVCADEDCEAQPYVHGDTEAQTITRWNTREPHSICPACKYNPEIEIASGCRIDGLGITAIVTDCPKFKVKA